MLGWQNMQSLFGITMILAACWAASEDRKAFPWKMAVGSVLAQVVLVVMLFGAPPIRAVVAGLGVAIDGLSASTQQGVAFVFGFLAGTPDQPYPLIHPAAIYLFAFRVLPVILVVCALSALLWHWKILKWITQGFGFVFQRTMGLRGPAALAVASTVFMGQVEGAIVIRAYLGRLSRSELFMLLTVGMACVSGSTMVAYATILKDVLPHAAAHVMTASIISAPAGVLLARILVPRDAAVEAQNDSAEGATKKYDSSIDALIKGTADGLQIVLSVAATLIVIVALVGIVNGLLGLFGPIGGSSIKVERLFGYIFAPVAWCMGIEWREALKGGELLGAKLVLTEFTAFAKLGAIPIGGISDRTRIIMTYALCGFANIASVGINVAGYSVLAPERRAEVISLATKAMLAGFFATCMTAAVVGAMPSGLFGLG